jgi:hypothetical protein
MMKLFIKVIIAIVFLAIALPFTVLKGKDGRPLMSMGDLRLPNISWSGVPDAIELPKMPVGKGKKETVYQWRGADGVMQFTSHPPPEGIEYTVKSYDTNANVIPSIDTSPEPPEPSEPSTEKLKPETASTPSDSESPYSVDKIKKLFDDAENVTVPVFWKLTYDISVSSETVIS